MKKKAIYPGTFDPLTNGHVDIIERSLSVFDEVTILVASSPRKSPLLDPAKRVELIRSVFKNRKEIIVESWDGLIMDYAKKHKVQAVIRGLRAASDFEYEFLMAAMNKNLNSKVETFFMMTAQNLFFVSSTMIKNLFHFGGDISPYVPAKVNAYLKKEFRK
jgi:pantetheine-phosphate adenylyltransferase